MGKVVIAGAGTSMGGKHKLNFLPGCPKHLKTLLLLDVHTRVPCTKKVVYERIIFLLKRSNRLFVHKGSIVHFLPLTHRS